MNEPGGPPAIAIAAIITVAMPDIIGTLSGPCNGIFPKVYLQ